MSSYNDGGWNLKEAKDCLQRKCILQNDGNYVNAGSSSSSKSQNTHSNSALTSEDSKINIPQPSFESGSLKIQATHIITILLTTLVLIFGS